jgi:CheY-like chemotaxis protein/signal transduction histidine kinase
MAQPSRVQRFFQEAKRRKVYTSAVAYVAVSVVLIEVGPAVFDAFLPDQADVASRILTILLILGLPAVLTLAWIFDLGPGGLQRTDAIDEQQREPAAVGGGGWVGGFAAKIETRVTPIELEEAAPDPERVRRASLAFVRHELRTPINAIIGYSEMLLEDARDAGDDVAATDLERIQHCGREILALVDGSLNPERISAEAGRDLASYGEQIRADLRDPLGAVTGYTEMLIETSQEAAHTDRVPDLEKILVAAHNLLDLSNDIVAVATSAPGAVHAGMAKGALLAEGVLAKIRAVDSTNEDAERHGSLLVVDDSATNRDLLARQLARKGYVVTTADNGRDALERMAEQEFDLVLLDVLMPEMDGVEVLRRMKNDAYLHDTPVIMISALDEIDSVVRCLEIGAADFVSKPFHPTLLDARINATLTAHAARKQPQAADPGLVRIITGALPEYVVQRVRNGETRLLDGAPNAAVYFVDVEHAVAGSGPPAQRAAAIETLTELVFAAARTHGVATVVMHGGGLVMIGGFPQPQPDAADRLARAALALAHDADTAGLRFRSAMNAGALYAAVVGKASLSYWLWGDGIDLARRLAASGERGQIQVSPSCFALLKDRFAVASRGIVEIAGRGQVRGYVLAPEHVHT